MQDFDVPAMKATGDMAKAKTVANEGGGSSPQCGTELAKGWENHPVQPKSQRSL